MRKVLEKPKRLHPSLTRQMSESEAAARALDEAPPPAVSYPLSWFFCNNYLRIKNTHLIEAEEERVE